MEYKEKIERKVASASEASPHEVSLADDRGEAVPDQVRALSGQDEAGRVLFQSVTVTALQLLRGILLRDQQALEASISLGQREKLQAMMDTLEATTEALRQSLSEQGTQMLYLCAEPQNATNGVHEDSWWFALTEAIEALEDGMQQMSSLSGGQPEDSPAHRLSDLIADLLHHQHQALLQEAQQWIA